MTSIGIVKSVNGSTAQVLVERGVSCCDNCTQDYCDISTSGIETEAFNTVHAQVGQKVRVSMKPYTYAKGALLLYVLPVAALFAGALLGAAFLPSLFPGTTPDLLAAVGGFALFAGSLPPIFLFSRRMERKTENRSIIEAILHD